MYLRRPTQNHPDPTPGPGLAIQCHVEGIVLVIKTLPSAHRIDIDRCIIFNVNITHIK